MGVVLSYSGYYTPLTRALVRHVQFNTMTFTYQHTYISTQTVGVFGVYCRRLQGNAGNCTGLVGATGAGHAYTPLPLTIKTAN